jgi:hypothetical protein
MTPKGSAKMEVENNQEKSWGGARAGAGRKAGSATLKTREIADKCAQMGLTPLEVMVKAMMDYWEEGDRENAVKCAKDAAPYLHPRLSAIEVAGDQDNPVKMVVAWKS